MTDYRSPDLTLTPALGDQLVRLGGYVHPLFTDPAFLPGSPFAARPWPGQGLLLLMGGLAEQTEAYDDRTLALLGFERVDFLEAACDGDVIHLEIDALSEPADGAGRITRWDWRCVRTDGTLLARASARFLMRRPG